MDISTRPRGVGLGGSCQGQDRSRQGTCTKVGQAGPRLSYLSSFQGPKVFGEKVGSRKEPRLIKSSLRPRPGASILSLVSLPPESMAESMDRDIGPIPKRLKKLSSPSRLVTSSKGIGTCPQSSPARHSGSFPPRKVA